MYYLFCIGKALSLVFPRSICYLVAKILAYFKYYISKKDREILYYNFFPIIKDAKVTKKYARSVFVNFSYYLVDFFRYEKLDSNFIKKYVKIVGLENLNKAILRKKGIIMLTAHFGNYELGGAIFSFLGYPFYAVALSHKDKRLDRFFNKHRERFGIKVIPLKNSAKRCLEVLGDAKILGLLADRDFSKSNLKIKMFEKFALVPRGPAFLGLKTEATIVPGFFIREKKFFYKLIFEEPIFCDKKVYKNEEAIVYAYIKIFERYLIKYLDQWYLFEKYWL